VFVVRVVFRGSGTAPVLLNLKFLASSAKQFLELAVIVVAHPRYLLVHEVVRTQQKIFGALGGLVGIHHTSCKGGFVVLVNSGKKGNQYLLEQGVELINKLLLTFCSMIFHLNQIPSEAKIKKHIRQILFGKHISCPRCGTRKIYASEGRYRCKECRKPFSLLTNTYLEGTKLAYRTIWALLWCYTQQVPVRQTTALCNVSDKTVHNTFKLFRSRIPVEYTLLEGKIQLDEAFFGGRRGIGLMLAKQTGTRKLAHAIVPVQVKRKHAFSFLAQHVEPRSRLNTDGASIYKNIDQWWPVKHKKDIHSKWEFGLTSEIEGLFGNLRTFLRRMYHHVSVKHFPEYAGEFCARFSHPEMFFSPLTFLEYSFSSVPTGLYCPTRSCEVRFPKGSPKPGLLL